MPSQFRFARRNWFPKLGFITQWDNDGGSPFGDHYVTSACVVRPNNDHVGNLLVGLDLVQKIGQHRYVDEVTFRECSFVQTEVKLTPQALL